MMRMARLICHFRKPYKRKNIKPLAKERVKLLFMLECMRFKTKNKYYPEIWERNNRRLPNFTPGEVLDQCQRIRKIR